MQRLLVQLRVMQLFNHSAHNLTGGPTFSSDHDFFAEMYAEAEAGYDSVAERLIGTVGPKMLNLSSIIEQVANECKGLTSSDSPNDLFTTSLKLEKNLCSIIYDYISANQVVKGVPMSEGTRQMLGDLCDKSEIRQYKLKQRLKK